jgi:hypothetical protein
LLAAHSADDKAEHAMTWPATQEATQNPTWADSATSEEE